MNIQDEYLVLQCPNCLGKLEGVLSDLFVESNGLVIYIGDGTDSERLECKSCGTVLQRKQKVNFYKSNSKFSVNISNATGFVIGDNASITMNFD